MTDRHNWHPGASTIILHGWKNHTPQGFEEYRKAGMKYAEFSVPVWENAFEGLDFFDHTEKICSVAKSCGVEFSSVHAPFSQEVSLSHPDKDMRHAAVEMIKRTAYATGKAGIKTMVMHPSCGHYEEYSDRAALLRQCMEHIGEICDYCESVGVTPALENMTGAGICGVPHETLEFLNAFPKLKLCFDTNHCVHILPEDYLGELIKAGMQGRVITIHASDYNLGTEMHLLPGEGKIKWQELITKLEELDYSGVFMYETSRNCETGVLYSPQTLMDNFESLIKI